MFCFARDGSGLHLSSHSTFIIRIVLVKVINDIITPLFKGDLQVLHREYLFYLFCLKKIIPQFSSLKQADMISRFLQLSNSGMV